MIYLLFTLVSSEWFYYEVTGEDIDIYNCQFYTSPCQNPAAFPLPRRAASGVIYKTWNKTDIDNLCPGFECGPFCNTTDPSCYVEYAIPKSISDVTLGGRDLLTPSGTTDSDGMLNETYCPPNCCQSENCRRYRDIEGSPVPENHEILLVFGGSVLRNVTVNGVSLFNFCNPDTVTQAEALYGLALSQSCGVELHNEIWRYDITDNTWTYVEPTYPPTLANYSFPFPRHSHAAVLVEVIRYDPSVATQVLQKFMYVYGGFALECRDACDDMWKFEIPWAAQEYYPRPIGGFWNRGGYWEQIINEYSPGRRMRHSMVVSNDFSKIFLFGGLGENNLYGDIWRFEVSSNVWEKLIPYGISSVVRKVTTWNGTIYDLQVNISDKRVNDTVTYSKTGSLPTPRSSASLLYFNSTTDYLFLFGGLGMRERLFSLGNASVALDDFWVFSLASQKWTQVYSETTGPSARFDANIMVIFTQQLDSYRLLIYGGRKSDIVFNDFWVYNTETSHWFNWTEMLSSGPIYPSGRYKGILAKTQEGLIIYSGSYTSQTNLSASDNTTEDYLTYVTACQEILNQYSVSIYDIGTEAFAEKQAELYNLTESDCFLRNTPTPTFTGDIEYLQGIWLFNLEHCEADCSGHGFCEFGTCYCDTGYFGVLCQYFTCPGTFCIYDGEFFSGSTCIHCSGYGECNNGTCNCTAGYSGTDCSMQTCADDCNFNGECMQFYPVSQCDCQGKFGGDTCAVVLCLNNCNEPHGTCNLTTGDCECGTGYYGIDCSVVGFSFGNFLKVLGICLASYLF